MNARFALGLIASLGLLSSADARVVELRFAMQFTQTHDFLTHLTTGFGGYTTATVKFDVDDTRLRGTYDWNGQLQAIDTYFGAPIIVSPYIKNIPKPTDIANWRLHDASWSMATNIDYGVSWPEGPYGRGPYVYHQFSDSSYGYKDDLVWVYNTGFSFGAPGTPATDIRQLSGDEILDYIALTAREGKQYTFGLTSYVYRTGTYENLYGASYLGTAIITGMTVLSVVPEPSTILMLLSALPLLGWVNLRRLRAGHCAKRSAVAKFSAWPAERAQQLILAVRLARWKTPAIDSYRC